MNPTDVFEVDHNITYRFSDMVPFDSYYFTASVFALEKTHKKSVPIVAFTAGEAADNFVLSSNVTHTNDGFTYDPTTSRVVAAVESTMIQIVAKRSKFAQAFTLCLLLVNWALTIGSIYITLLVIIRGEKMDAAVLVLPVTIVLTIPTLRGLYVGSPPFGVYIGKFLVLRP